MRVLSAPTTAIRLTQSAVFLAKHKKRTRSLINKPLAREGSGVPPEPRGCPRERAYTTTLESPAVQIIFLSKSTISPRTENQARESISGSVIRSPMGVIRSSGSGSGRRGSSNAGRFAAGRSAAARRTKSPPKSSAAV